MITLAGKPLLIEDHSLDLNEWMRQVQSLDDLREFGCLPPYLQSERKGSRNGEKSGVGLPLPNYSEGPPAKLNSLYWPTGAARWGRFFGLADEETKNFIVAESISQGNARRIELQMGDEDHVFLFVDMWVLPPRPISGLRSNDLKETLWLIPLVDDRYWWQFINIDDFEVTKTTTWDELFDQISTQIGQSLLINYGVNPTGLTNAAYLNPDPVEFTRKYDNIGLLLDAACQSNGLRFVYGFRDHLFFPIAHSSTLSYNTYEANLLGNWQILAGGDFSTTKVAPQKVVVTFPKWSWGVPWCNGDVWKEISGATELDSVPNTFKEIHSSCYADMTLVSTPKNQAALATLASQITADYYEWFRLQYDYTFAGIKAWLPNGFDDYVEWTFGRQLEDGRYQAQTRVATQPHNFGVESQLSQNPNWIVLGHFQIGKMHENLVPQCEGGPGYADVNIWDVAAGQEQSINFRVRGYAWPNEYRINEPDGVELHWHCEENAWYVFPQREGFVVLLEAKDCFMPGQTGTFKLLKYDRVTSTWIDTGETVTAFDPGFWNCVLPGEQVFARVGKCGRYDLLGPYGLYRKAKANADIPCGQNGFATLYSDKANNSCAASASNCVVAVCNTWAQTRKMISGDEMYVSYFGTNPLTPGDNRRWMIMPHYQPRWATGTLASTLCPGDAVAQISNAVYVDGCGTANVTTALNRHSDAGTAGKNVLLLRMEDGNWLLVRVQGRSQYVVVQNTIDSGNCSISIVTDLLELSVMTCEQTDQDNSAITLEAIDAVTGISVSHTPGASGPGSAGPTEGSCNFNVTKRSLCAFPGTGQTIVDVMQMEPLLAVQDVFVDGLCIKGTVIIGYVFCIDSPDEVTFFCGADCASGSGSQSGGQ